MEFCMNFVDMSLIVLALVVKNRYFPLHTFMYVEESSPTYINVCRPTYIYVCYFNSAGGDSAAMNIPSQRHFKAWLIFG